MDLIYSAALLNSFILVVFFFFKDSLRLDIKTIVWSMNKENFTSSFLGCMLLISFFPYCAGWNLHCRVHRCGQSRHPGLFLGLQGRALRFSLLSVTLAVESLWLPFTTVSECSNGQPNLHSWDVPHLIVYHWIYWKIGKVSVREGYQSVASLPRVPLCGFSMVSWLRFIRFHFLEEFV